jgi:sugar phosphate isomerase/epimerase
MKNDFAGTMEKVAKIGYDAVELAEYGGLSATAMKKLLSGLGLKVAGSHESIDRLQKELDKTIEYNQEIGNHFVVCPFMPKEWSSRGAAGFTEFGKILEKAGTTIKKAGLQLCYHNHDFEFAKADGKYLMDFLFEAASADLVKSEVDAYWVKHADIDPAAFLEKHAGRCKLVHMKDMTGDGKKFFAPVGTGIMDFKAIVQAARKAGVVWFIVEQDQANQPVLEAITISLQNMRKLLAA